MQQFLPEDLLEFARVFIGIGLLSLIFYYAYRIVEATQAVHLFRGSFSIAGLYLFAVILRLDFLLWLLDKILPGMLLGLAIVFQPELRKIFLHLGQGYSIFSRYNGNRDIDINTLLYVSDELAKRRRGCLIVIQRSVGLKDIVDSGTILNSDLSSDILLSLFLYDAPLHDGAAIITGNKLLAAGCFLPLSTQADIQSSFGTRHRAALGMSENSDSITLVISEENGAKSIAYDSQLLYNLTNNELITTIKSLLKLDQTSRLKK